MFESIKELLRQKGIKETEPWRKKNHAENWADSMQLLFSSGHLLILGVGQVTKNLGKEIEEMVTIKNKKFSRAFYSLILERYN